MNLQKHMLGPNFLHFNRSAYLRPVFGKLFREVAQNRHQQLSLALH
ncbi:MAG: hypothetical protein JO275_02405 [Verrucomicrobia bacterium]|nr:hypothetical protein [Verrucomicrobiota bacterium]